MKIISSIFLVLISQFIHSCSKEKYARIEIISPVNNQSYIGSTTVEVTAKIYDDGDSIMNEELLVTLNNATSTTPVVDFKDAKFCFEYDLNKSFVAQPGNEYKIQVKARGGHGNWSDRTIIVQCH